MEFQQLSTANSSISICLFGATVTSFKTQGEEHFFVSEQSLMDGSKPIRGGIPLVFPQFGAGPLPNHGFARTSTWTVAESVQGQVESTMKLVLNPETKNPDIEWQHSFVLELSLHLVDGRLTTSLAVHNQSSNGEAFPFQALLHTYYAVNDITNVKVFGLEGTESYDQLTAETVAPTGAPIANISQETDAIYRAAPTNVRMETGDFVYDIEKTLTSSVRGSLPCDMVVWNPWVDKSKRMGDFGDEEFHKMICLEPGCVNGFVTCEAGEVCTLQQTISVSHKAAI